MNILGHCYVALRVFGGLRKNDDSYHHDLIVGTLLPESSPFIANNPFTFEEIHEGGERLLSFLKREYPAQIGIALGMIAHGVKYGADGFNKEIEIYGKNEEEKLIRKISTAFNIPISDAPKRLHNVLWAGVDFWLFNKYPDIAERIKGAIKHVDIRSVSAILAGCFDRDNAEAEEVVDKLFRHIYLVNDLNSKKGLVRIGARHAAGLPEKDVVDFEKAKKLIEECQEIMEDSWEELIGEVGKSVKARCRRFVIGY